MNSAPHTWIQCNPVIRVIETGDIDERATTLTKAFVDQLTTEQRQAFHQALCYQSAGQKHRRIMHKYTEYLREHEVIP